MELPLNIEERPALRSPKLIMGFSGWMDGGEVSTGTIDYLVRMLDAPDLGVIDPEEFFIYAFPGSMEVSALFRPHVLIEDGLIQDIQEPASNFFYDEAHDLILFEGKEPHMHWTRYAECLFSLVQEFNVSGIYFVGSVAGLIPHTREPRLFASVSDGKMRPLLDEYGLHPSNYEGPGSFITYLTLLAREEGIPMMSLIAEVPAYVQGENVKCIAAVVRKLDEMLGLSLEYADLDLATGDFERKLDQVVRKRPELQSLLEKIEQDYDEEMSDEDLADIRDWFERQGLRLD